jgi:formate-dependent nitrite reductase membrane component NrfD
MPWNANGKIMIEGDDLDTETDFIKRVESEFEKTRRDADGMKRLHAITDGISAICLIVIFVISSYKGVQFISLKMNQAYDAAEWSWYFMYTALLILCGSLILKVILKVVQGAYEDN